MRRQVILFILNGGMATVVHFSVLFLLIELFHVPSLVWANLTAGAVAITCSFMGNKYIVFNSHNEVMLHQLLKFVLVYICALFFHTFAIYELSSVYGIDYRVAFVVASFLVIMFTFLSNKLMVFK